MNRIFSNIGFFLKYIWNLNKIYCICNIPNIILLSVEPFILIIFPKLIIDGILSGNLLNDLFEIVITMLILSLIIKLLRWFLHSLSTKEYNKLVFSITENLGLKVMSLKFEDVENPEILDLFNRVQKTLNVNSLLEALINIISNFITIIGLIIIISQLNILILCVTIVVVAINVLCDGLTKKYDYQWQVNSSIYQRKFDYISQIMYDFKFGKEVRVNNLNNYIKRKYENVANQYNFKLSKIINKFLKLNWARSFASVFQDAILYSYLVYKTFIHEITIGNFTMFTSAISSFTTSLTSITSAIVDISQQSKFIEDFKSFIELDNMDKSGTKNLDDVILSKGSYEFEFKNVSFKYPSSDKYALKNISLKIKENQKISIVGLNGAGKTTFIKLLLRLYKPTEGKIYLNSVDIQSIKFNDYIKFFSVVFQDFQLFSFSIEENIVLNLNKDKSKVKSVILESGLEYKVNSLPKAEGTQVFKIFDEEGIEFSGGEAQKLVIARALYKDTPFIILDEPTSALDPLSEYEIYNKFNTLAKNKTAIYISHRLSSTKLCDYVVVFSNSEIIQYGTHESLMKEDGLYKEMYSKQSNFYIKEKEN